MNNLLRGRTSQVVNRMRQGSSTKDMPKLVKNSFLSIVAIHRNLERRLIKADRTLAYWTILQ